MTKKLLVRRKASSKAPGRATIKTVRWTAKTGANRASPDVLPEITEDQRMQLNNRRRIQLILQDEERGLSDDEREELTALSDLCMNYVRRLYPLPVDKLKELEEVVRQEKAAKTGVRESVA